MPRVVLDESIQRVTIDGFQFPLGAYPVENMAPGPGYVLEFEPADGGSDGFPGQDEPDADDMSSSAERSDADDADADAADAEPRRAPGEAAAGDDWEEWPDRFMFDVLISAQRLPALVAALTSLLPGRIYPILDVLGNDAYREIDPYIAYDLVGVERFYDGIARYGPWLFEDGLVGFGAMTMDPFFYLFVDEHKAVTIRVGLDDKERVERLLAAFDLREVQEIRGADAAQHEHRGVLLMPAAPPAPPASSSPPPPSTSTAAQPDDEPDTDTGTESGAGADAESDAADTPTADALTAEEIIERLRDAWSLQLNIDARRNLDDEGRELGATGWRCVVRCAEDDDGPVSYAEILLVASNLEAAEGLALDAVVQHRPESMTWSETVPVAADRLTPDEYTRTVHEAAREGGEGGGGGGARGGGRGGGRAGGAPDAEELFTAERVHAVRWVLPRAVGESVDVTAAGPDSGPSPRPEPPADDSPDSPSDAPPDSPPDTPPHSPADDDGPRTDPNAAE